MTHYRWDCWHPVGVITINSVHRHRHLVRSLMSCSGVMGVTGGRLRTVGVITVDQTIAIVVLTIATVGFNIGTGGIIGTIKIKTIDLSVAVVVDAVGAIFLKSCKLGSNCNHCPHSPHHHHHRRRCHWYSLQYRRHSAGSMKQSESEQSIYSHRCRRRCH